LSQSAVRHRVARKIERTSERRQRRARRTRWLKRLAVGGGAAVLVTAVAIPIVEGGPPPPSCGHLVHADLAAFGKATSGALTLTLAYDQLFLGSVKNAREGQPPGPDPWGAANYRASIVGDKKSLEALHPPAAAQPAQKYELLAMDIYAASTHALETAATVTEEGRLQVIQQASRLKALGDRVFDRGRAMANLDDVSQREMVLAPAVPDFAVQDLGPAGSALAPAEEKPTPAPVWRNTVKQVARAVPNAVQRGDWVQLDGFVKRLSASVTGNACLTEVGRGLQDGLAVAGEAAWASTSPAGAQEATLSRQLASTAVAVWNEAATLGRLPKLH
jgi:hypothetical protein